MILARCESVLSAQGPKMSLTDFPRPFHQPSLITSRANSRSQDLGLTLRQVRIRTSD